MGNSHSNGKSHLNQCQPLEKTSEGGKLGIWEAGTGLGSAAQRVFASDGFGKGTGSWWFPENQHSWDLPMVSSSGGTSTPAMGLLECLGKDKWNVHPGRSEGPLPQDLNSVGIWGWARKFRSGSILAIPMGCREDKGES